MIEDVISEQNMSFSDALKIVKGLQGHLVDVHGSFLDEQLNHSNVQPMQAITLLDTYFNPRSYVIGHEITAKYSVSKVYSGLVHRVSFKSTSLATNEEAGRLTISYFVGATRASREFLLAQMHQDAINQCPYLQDAVNYAEEENPQGYVLPIDPVSESSALASAAKPVKGLRKLLKAVYDTILGKSKS